MSSRNLYDIDDAGWVPRALLDIRNNIPCSIVIKHEDIASITSSIESKVTAINDIPFVQNMFLHLIGNLSSSKPDPTFLVSGLAVTGALGGAAGTVCAVLGAAHSHRSKIRLVFDVPSDLLDPRDLSLSVEIDPPAKTE